MSRRRSSAKERDTRAGDPQHGAHLSGSLLIAPHEKLGELLVRCGRVSPTQVDEALLQQLTSGTRTGVLLVELGAIDERDLAWALSEQFALDFIDLGRETPDPDAVALLSESAARAEAAIPVRLAGTQLVIAVADVSSDLLARLTAACGR
ncbi:MAG: pilus biosynthesis protein PilB, partial [Acidimicrobiales bacterium]|nr:pilus biosynthesis protein PilB [Acidimicrobiales bacterium]